MLKLKTTAKEAVAVLKAQGYQIAWRVATRTYTAQNQFGETVTIYAALQIAEADSIQKENELVAAFPGFFTYIEDVIEEANQDFADSAAERAENAQDTTPEGKLPTESDNAPHGDSEGFSAEPTGLTISIPLDGFTDASLDNLKKLVNAKGNLIRKALGADRIMLLLEGENLNEPYEGTRLTFPWWATMPEPEEIQAYMAFIAALCAFAKQARRVNTTERQGEVESERYAFRSFLLRLGFIGPECAAQRKLLLKRLSGAAAFPNKEKYAAFCSTQKAKRDAAKEVG